MSRDSIKRLAAEVQARLRQLYAKVGTPDPDSALDQAGLRDGEQIVLDYLQHNEAGLAFEHLLYMIVEPDVALPADLRGELESAGRELGYEPRAWSRVRVE